MFEQSDTEPLQYPEATRRSVVVGALYPSQCKFAANVIRTWSACLGTSRKLCDPDGEPPGMDGCQESVRKIRYPDK